MEDLEREVKQLRARVKELESKNLSLENQAQPKSLSSENREGYACPNEKCLCTTCSCGPGCTCGVSPDVTCDPCANFKKASIAAKKNQEVKGCPLTTEQISRYSRQLLVPDFGIAAQERVSNASVLIVGAGGLGSAVALYLAGAGVGKIGIVDGDIVERSNLHRQIMHKEASEGLSKVFSACQSMKELNSSIQCIPYPEHFQPSNAIRLVSDFHLVIDASDNLATRYLINDACILVGRSLISGSAQGADGQITVYNYPPGQSLCLRCHLPKPPPAASIMSCSDGGVLGPVPGVIGTLQALEALKVLGKVGTPMVNRMGTYDSLHYGFSYFKMMGRRASCAVCSGDSAVIKSIQDSAKVIQKDGLQLAETGGTARTCSTSGSGQMIDPKFITTCPDYANSMAKEHLLLDVREPVQFAICHLPNALSCPLRQLIHDDEKFQAVVSSIGEKKRQNPSFPVFIICRRGIDSQRAILHLASKGDRVNLSNMKHIEGGLEEWQKSVDPNFPMY